MAKFTLTLLFACVGAMASAQLSLLKNTHDFGVLHRADEPWADFTIQNNTDKPAVLFRVENPKRTEVVFSKKTIPPGDSAVVRIQYLPERTGSFHLAMNFYASAWNEPRTLEIRGESTYAASDGIPCPDFSQVPAGHMRPLIVSVRDEMTGQPLEGAGIRVYQHGREVAKGRTNAYGEFSGELTLGRYFFAVDHRGQRTDTALVVNAVNNHLLIGLPDLVVQAEPTPEAEVENEPEVADFPEEAELREVAEEVVETDDEKGVGVFGGGDSPGASEDHDGTLSTALYKESNLVFLVDVSSSMKANGRLDLLKIAMTDLLSVLRPDDRFALIQYASTTGTIIETRGNLNREECMEAIASLEAGGETKGAKAINVAGRTASKHFIPEGNNQIILATDGSFNEGAAKAINLSKKFRKQNIHLSVLGIRCSNFGEREMRELADAGGGRFVSIDSPGDAGQKLIGEIKMGARR